ncbi:MAG: hypothetical protein GX883_01880 [Firmicutes bacterium]|nr:hypothetical protein [Bacillota bacterium]
MSEEIAKVLRMIEQGTLTAEEGLPLVESLQDDNGGGAAMRPLEQAASGMKRKLRIKISDAPTGKTKLNIAVPVGLVKLLPALIPAGVKKKAGDLDFDRLLDDLFDGLVSTDPSEKLLDVVDDEDGDRVQIYFA